jgi:hypothetical protein
MRKSILIATVGLTSVASCTGGAIVGAWWQARSKSDHWDTKILKATFRAAYLEGDPGHQSPIFSFQIENTSNRDYAIQSASDIQLYVRDKGALDSWLGSGLTIDTPLFIPAKDKALAVVHFKVVEKDVPLAGASTEEQQRYLRDKAHVWNQYDSITMIDKVNRLQVELPIGTR